MASPTDDAAGPNAVHWNIEKSPSSPGAAPGEQVASNADVAPSSETRTSDETTPTLLEADKPESKDGTPESLDKFKGVVDSAKKKFHLDHISASGPSKLFNPTNVHMRVRLRKNDSNDGNAHAGGDPRKELALLWRSRDNRKGRGSVAIPNSAYPFPHDSPAMTLNLKHLFEGIRGYSTHVHYLPVLGHGSLVWLVIEHWICSLCTGWSLFLWTSRLSLDRVGRFFDHLVPHTENHRDEEEVEKREENVDPETGWRTKGIRARPGSIYPGMKKPAPRRGGVDLGEAEEGDSSEYLTWRWWPTWHRLRTHHIYEIGYLACSIQLLGATLYGMCGVVVLPGLLSSLTEWQANVAYWIPQVVASVCFLSAGLLFTFETQEKCYKPKYKDLGWWIGFWAVVGSCGFLLCGALGLASYHSTGAAYQSSLSSMWGSAGCLLSSLLQWYEAVNKHENVELSDDSGEAN